MDLISITMVTLWFVWMILIFIHTLRIIGIDGFYDRTFKAGKSKTIANNYNIEFDKIKLNTETENMRIRELKIKKCILISIKRPLFSLKTKDEFYKFRTVIDYSNPENIHVKIHWDNHWILQFYIFIILLPALFISGSNNIILTVLLIVIPYFPFYYLLHKRELLKVKAYEERMLKILMSI